MKLEKLEDLLEIDTDTLKTAEKSRLFVKVKQLIKTEKKQEAKAEDEAATFDYKAVSVVGNRYIEVGFDLKSKVGRIIFEDTDPRDTRGKNYMAGSKAIKRIQEFVKEQKEKINE